MKKEMVCISCPMGCRLSIKKSLDGVLTVSGNKCQRGEVYAKEEILSPKRVVTATVKLNLSLQKRIPVKTDKPLPKEHIDFLLNNVYKIDIKAPVKLGDVILENIKNTGINLVACKSVGRK